MNWFSLFMALWMSALFGMFLTAAIVMRQDGEEMPATWVPMTVALLALAVLNGVLAVAS